MKNSEMKVGKELFLAIFITAISLYSICIILDIISLVEMAKEYYFNEYSYLYISLFLDIILCSFFVFASGTILFWQPDNRGGALFLATDLYVVINGFVSMVINIMDAISNRVVSAASFSMILAIIAIIQVCIGTMGLILRNRRPMAAKIIGIISFAFLAVTNLALAVSNIIYGSWISSIIEFIVVAFYVVVIVAFYMMKKEKQGAQALSETPNQLQNQKYVSYYV